MLTVLVTFPDAIPAGVQGPALLAFEKHLRQLAGAEIQVFKDKMRDDSKLRIKMTPQERATI